ncbi:hemagglutinin repeat-containing protein [Pseudomonas mercuritolerans]|uniref:Hemagglutinin repeat-containing protein n=1 Tax=Pseudomonas mercuritolerans TaxID=2951809 RepID=A0ABT2XV52_9PSED|nr:hemagglutinin repeat-containing protein [Pseudomonas mercuritolerans]MCV2221741.1 hemagglutinin repeat-containing protein [Pseudomonas mercuritolerans]
MDVRQYAFLARQPSAVVAKREQFLGMPKRGLAFLLANVMFWQPLWARADGIVVANPNTTLDRAGNGVPIVNIATPNASGLSHNQFHDYNVGAQGVILNNGAAQTTYTQLGGHVIGNPNLKNSGSAQAILNEVISGNPSQLRGYTEVAGQSARVIVANPYGITCNGCGFINAPRVTLTTGKPVLENGRLDRFQVDQGSVAIEGAGINATNIDRFEIITRSAKINAQIQAQNLTIVAGRNDVNADSLNAMARADDGSAKPQLAIDSSALGGMYAGAIKLVGTEAGVGVKLDGKLIASGGDIQIDANGQLSLADTSTTGAVNVKAASLDAQAPIYAGTSLNVQTQGNLTNRQTLAARDSVVLSAGGQLTNAGAIEAGVNADGGRNSNGDLSLRAQNLNNSGKSLSASRNLTVNAAQTLNNQNGLLSGQTTSITAGTLDNRNAGKVLGNNSLTLIGNQVLNNQGTLTSNGRLTGNIGQLLNSNGELGSQSDVVLTVTSLDNVAGLITAGRLLDITALGAINNRTGRIGAKQAVAIKAQQLDNSQQGQLTSEGTLTTRISDQLNNQNKGLILANGAMDVQATRLDNRAGKISGLDTLTVSSATTDNRAGVLRADKAMTVLIDNLDNREKGRAESKAALTFEGSTLNNSNGGLLTSTGLLNLKARDVTNDAGRISGKGDVDASIDNLTQQTGELVAEGNLKLTGKTLNSRQDSLVGSLKTLTVNVDQIDNRASTLSSQLDLHIDGARLDNSEGGKVLSDTTLGLKVAQIINATNGLIFSKGAATLSGIGLSNVGGRIVSQNTLDLTFDNALDNQQGLISSEGQMTLNLGSLDNRLGKLSSLEAMALTSVAGVQNQGGLIASQKGLTFTSGSLDNSDNGILSAKADSTLTTGEFKNRQGGSLATDGTLLLTTAHLDNSGGIIGSQKTLQASVTSLKQDGGELFSNGDLTLDLNNGLLDNQRGNIHTPGQLLLKNLKDVNNSAGEISAAKAWNLNAQSLNNDGGKLLSNEKLTLVIDRALSNVKGQIASAGLQARSASLDNSGGEIRGRGTVDFTVTDLFDNQAGVVIADEGLTLTAARLDNRREGLVGSTQALQLVVDRVDNRSGELSSKAGVSLIGAWLDNSDSGYMLAGGNLALTVNEVINRNNGVLSGATGLTLVGKSLENSARLATQQDLAITLSGELNNAQGSLFSEGALAIDAQSLNNDGGTLSSAKALSVDTRGAVSNRGGQLLTDAALTLTSSALDNQQKGVISSKSNLHITTGELNNSQASIYAADQLELSAGKVTNTAGSLGAGNALTADIQGLDQQGGKLFSSHASVSVDLHGGALNNHGGVINAPGQLLLKNLAEVNNRGGEISSEQAFELIAKSLDNSGGQVLSNQKLSLTLEKALTSIKGTIAAAALQVRAASLDNSDGGVLLSDSDISVTVDGLLDNHNKGSIRAAQQLTLNSTGLNNQNGTLVGAAGTAIDLGTTAQDLDNQGGVISSKGALSIAHLRDLNNQDGVINSKGVLSIATLRDLNNQKGEVSSVNSFSLSANSLDNRGGNLISNQQLTSTAAELKNQGGLVSGWTGVSLAGGTIDNSLGGAISSQLGNVSIDLSGALINHSQGGVGSKGELFIKAASLNNSAGTLTSDGKQTLTVLGGELNNASGGLIKSADALDIRAASLNNASGNLNAKNALTFTGGALNNSGGSLVGDDRVTLDLLGALTNVNGALGSTGPLVLTRSTSIDNRGGQMISQSLLSLLTSGDLNNSQRGTIAGSGQLNLTAGGLLRNDGDGLISSGAADAILTAAALNNAGGAVQSMTALTVNTGNGAIDNQGGKIIAQNGDLNLTAASLDSRGGVLSSLKGLLQTRLTGVLRNGQSGKIEGSRLDLRALGGIYSDGGRIAANSGDILLNAGGNALDNSGGGIYARGQVNVIAGSMNNTAGQVSGSLIDLGLGGNLANNGGLIESASTLAIRAANLNNQSGKLRALGGSGKTDFQIGSQFDNRNGLVETANTDFTLAAPSLLNAGGTVTHVGLGEFGISTANVMNAGGSLVTRGGLTLNADSWTNSSVIQAGRLTVNVGNFVQTASGQLLASNQLVGRGGNWTNEGLIASDGGLDIQLSGNYGGNGRVSSVGDLGLLASRIDLSSVASITGASTATVTSRGTLSNLGRLTSADSLTVNTASLVNNGTLGSAGNLRITSDSLLNENGLIFSGRDMNLRVGSLTNRYADIYGMGNISIARDDSNGWSSSINNISATIESVGDLSLSADHIENRKDVFEVAAGGGLVSGTIGVRCTTCTSFSGINFESRLPSHLVWVEKYHSTIVRDSASGTLTAGRDLTGNGREFINNASVVSAGRNLTFNVENFTNQGATAGDYTVTRWLDAPRAARSWGFWQDVLNYNAANDPDYDSGYIGALNGKRTMVPNIHVWDMNDVESLTRIGGRQGGREAIRYLTFGSIAVEYDSGKLHYAAPSYDTGVRAEAPDFLKNAVFTRDTVTESTPTSNANAVVQAGGTVYINATNKIDNGVVRNGNASVGGASRLGSTQLAGQVTPTVIRINAQLPPDLAQQQVNPLALPGFTLPSGDNGLFRLSKKDGSEPAMVAAEAWKISSISAAPSTHAGGMPVRHATEFKIDDNALVSVKNRELALADRQSLNLNDKTAMISVNAAESGGLVRVSAPDRGNVSFDVPRVQGLPDTSVRSNPHKYLIETNPVLTDLKKFESSDYLLQKLGYDPDTSAKRLGDGLFEQRLVQQAVVARTGQRFIDGQTSDEAMFKYLMNNAIASKDQLNLSMGVTLTAQQVAALTHDIVWLEEHEVNGEKVLVPVLYLAQANNRLAPNGALIQGGDVTLIAGGNLDNAGTLRASNNLSAEAGNNLTNSGLIEAGERLTLKAGNDIINKSGGIISGKNVSLTATNGSVINQRDVSSVDVSRGGNVFHRDYLDNAARIEAANDLTIKAGLDINNIGGVLKSGQDMTLDADRDVNITSVQNRSTNARGSSFLNQSITQHGAEVTSGRDLSISADRDVAIVASRLDAKRDISLNAGNDLLVTSAANESEFSARSKRKQVESINVSQQSSVISSGRDIAASAGNDLNLIASRISASNEAYLFAGDDVNIATAEDVDYDYYSKTKKGSFGKKKSTMSESETVLSVSSTVEAGSKLVVSAGQDVNLTGAKLSSDGTLLASAGRDINLLSAQDSYSQASASSKKSWNRSKSSSSEQTQTRLNSTELSAKDIELKSSHDITLQAAALRAENEVKLTAANDVLIGTAEETLTSSQSKGSSKTGMTVTGWLSNTQKTQRSQQSSTQSTGSDISAGSIQINSGRDSVVEGSTLVADKNIGIDAGRNLEITSAENYASSSSKSGSKKVGEVGSWWQGATGIVKTKETSDNTSTRQSGSQIASLGGNISLSAGDHYTQSASQLVTPQGDIDIKAKHVDIEAGFDTLNSNKTASTSRTAIGGTVNIPLVDALRGIQQMGEAAQKTSDDRMVALAAVNAAMSANQAMDAGQAMMQNPVGGIKVSVNLSNSQSKMNSSQSGRNVVASDVVAGGKVNIVATGAGADSDINVVGSRIEGGGDVSLKADGEINLLSAQNTAHQQSANSNSGWSAGIGFGFGESNGITFELAANVGRGSSDGDDVTHTNTSIKSGQTLSLESGGDTNIKGAVATGETVKVKVGGDLNVESQQDTSTYTSKQMSANVGVSICVPPFCYGTSSVSGGIAAQHMQSEYASVSEQSGIKAGDGGFQVEVKGNTDLVGAVIASTDKAVADGKNTLSTGTLTSSDIKNKADYDASSINLSGGYGGDIGRDKNGNASATANRGGPVVASKDGVSATTPVVLFASDSSSSTTRSGISGAAVTITNGAKQQELTGQTAEQATAAINQDVSSDRDGSNKLKPIFNAEEIDANFEIVGKFVQNVSQFVEDRAREIDNKKKQADLELAASLNPNLSETAQLAHHENYIQLQQQIKEIGDNWGAGGTYRQIATALVAGISGNVSGSSAQFAQNMVVNYVQQQGSSYIGDLVKKGLKEGSPTHAALHAILGCAGAAASNQSCSAGALGGSAASVLAGLFADSDPNETAIEREAKRNIITSLVTGIAAMSNPNGAATANNAATANIDNNWLATQQYVQAMKEIDAEPNVLKKLAIAAKWQIQSSRQDLLTGSGVLKGFTDGMAGAGLGTLDSAVMLMRDPVQSWDAVVEFAGSAEAQALLGEAIGAAFKSQIDQIGKALVEGGDANAENLGRQMGQAVALVVQLLAGGGSSSANSALTLSRMGIDVSVNTVKKIGASFDLDTVKTQISKLPGAVRDTDVPVVDPVKPPKTGGGLAGNGEGLFSNVNRTPYSPKGETIGQAFDFSCVAASCKMAANLVDTPEAYIRQAILMEADGAFLSNVPNGLKDLGFTGTATYSSDLTVKTITSATKSGAAVIVNVRTELGGLHAIVVDSVENGMAGIRDPWPLGVGSTYSVPANALEGILNGGVIVHP